MRARGATEGTTDTVIGVELAPDGRHLLIYEGSGAHGGGAIGWLLSRMHLLSIEAGPTRGEIVTEPYSPVHRVKAATCGHGGSDFVEEAADALAFAAQQFGMMTPVAGGT